MSNFAARGSCLRTLFLVVGGALILCEAPAVLGQKKHPAEEKGIRSVKSEIEASIEFYNAGQQNVKVFWIDLDGKRQLFHVLKPGDRQTQKTFINHPWLLTDEKDNSLGLYFPDPDKRVVTFGDPVAPFAKGKGFKGGGKGARGTAQTTRLSYLQDPTVKLELMLTDEQAAKFKELAAKQKDALAAIDRLPVTQRTQQAANLRQEADKVIADLLNAGQAKRLDQIVRQEQGAFLPTGIFSDKTLLAMLQLTPEQQTKLKEVQTAFSAQITAAGKKSGTTTPEFAKEVAQHRKTAFENAQALLTPQQKKAWDDLVGSPFQGHVRTSMTGGNPSVNPFAKKGGFGVEFRASAFVLGKSATSNFRLLSEKSVQDALKLTDEQKKQAANGGFGQPGLLNAAQLKQYQGIHLQVIARVYGPTGPYRYREASDALNLTDEQRAKIIAIGQEDSRGYSALPSPRTDEAVKALDRATQAKLDQVLTDQQKARFKEVLGEPFSGAVQNPLGSTGRDPKGNKGGGPGFLRAGPYSLSPWNINGYFLAEKSIQQELKLTAEQIARANDLAKVTGPARSLPSDLLTPEQLKRYQGLYLQASTLTWGPAGTFRYTEVRKLLNLSEEQQQKVLAIGAEDSAQFKKVGNPTPAAVVPEAVQVLNKATEAKLLQVLNEEQRGRLKQLLGEPFRGTIEQPLGTRSVSLSKKTR